MKLRTTTCCLLFCVAQTAVFASNLNDLIQDRLLIDAVYESHRLGERVLVEAIELEVQAKATVQLNLKKESMLVGLYGFSITPTAVEAEVARISRTTRAPERLEELKAALENEPSRFARSVARPIVVDRELRRRFESDALLHMSQRTKAEQCRAALLANEAIAEQHELTWQLSSRPVEADRVTFPEAQTMSTELKSKSALYTIEAKAQIAEVLSAPTIREENFYFEDIDPELARVLKAQLNKAGDTSAVIETNQHFLVFQAKKITAEVMTVVSQSIPKHSYEAWVHSQRLSETEL